MSSTEEERLDSEMAKLALNASGFRYDSTLDRVADLLVNDPEAWARLPLVVRDHAGIYADFRDQYRRAVKAGAVPDDHGPTAA